MPRNLGLEIAEAVPLQAVVEVHFSDGDLDPAHRSRLAPRAALSLTE